MTGGGPLLPFSVGLMERRGFFKAAVHSQRSMIAEAEVGKAGKAIVGCCAGMSSEHLLPATVLPLG